MKLSTQSFWLGLMLAVFSIVAAGAMAQEEKKDEDKKEKEEPKIATVEVKTKPIKLYEKLDGKFEATNTTEIEAELEEWKTLKVEKIVEQGKMVQAGETIVWFEKEDYEEALQAAKLDFTLAELSFKDAELTLEEKNKTYDMDLKIMEREWQHKKDDFEYWQKVEFPQELDDLDYNEKTASYYLEYQKDELDQLLKMYTEDELTEESEAIVLKRAQRGVDSATRSLDRSMRRYKRQRETYIPRQKTSREESMIRAELAYNKKKITFPGTKTRAEIAFEKAKIAFDKAKEKFENIQKDGEFLELKAPSAGMLFYGKCKKGVWSGKRTIEIEDTLPGDTVIFTIVDPTQMTVRTSITESQLYKIKEGLQGTAVVKGMRKTNVPVQISSVETISGDGEKYACELALLAGVPQGLLPGMNCKVSVPVYQNENAIVVSAKSVFSDDDISHYVYMVENEKRVKRAVEVGYKSGDDIEIESGLAVGDKIAKTKE